MIAWSCKCRISNNTSRTAIDVVMSNGRRSLSIWRWKCIVVWADFSGRGSSSSDGGGGRCLATLRVWSAKTWTRNHSQSINQPASQRRDVNRDNSLLPRTAASSAIQQSSIPLAPDYGTGKTKTKPEHNCSPGFPSRWIGLSKARWVQKIQRGSVATGLCKISSGTGKKSKTQTSVNGIRNFTPKMFKMQQTILHCGAFLAWNGVQNAPQTNLQTVSQPWECFLPIFHGTILHHCITHRIPRGWLFLAYTMHAIRTDNKDYRERKKKIQSSCNDNGGALLSSQI